MKIAIPDRDNYLHLALFAPSALNWLLLCEARGYRRYIDPLYGQNMNKIDAEVNPYIQDSAFAKTSQGEVYPHVT